MKKLAAKLLLFSLLTLLSGCGYNTMQANEEAVIAAWGNVESSYQRRSDLIPNLVEVVKGYAKHEADTLKAVTEARAKVGSMQVTKDVLNNPASLNKFQQAQGELSVPQTPSPPWRGAGRRASAPEPCCRRRCCRCR